jgi:hypothetical protein
MLLYQLSIPSHLIPLPFISNGLGMRRLVPTTILVHSRTTMRQDGSERMSVVSTPRVPLLVSFHGPTASVI